MPFDIGEIVVQAQVIDDKDAQGDGRKEDRTCGSDVEKMRREIKAELRAEMKQLIREELERRARR